MAYEYTYLSVAARRELLVKQIAQFEGELFNHEMNIVRVQALVDDSKIDGSNAQASIDETEKAIKALEVAINATKRKLAELG